MSITEDLETKVLKQVKNKYILALLISKRVAQLQKGAKPLVPTDTSEQLYNIALRELAEGKVRPHTTTTKIPTTVPNLDKL